MSQAGNEFELVIKVIASVVTWVIETTLDVICFVLAVAACIIPWRLFSFMNVILDDKKFKKFRENYRMYCFVSFFGSMFDIVVMPFAVIGIVTLSRMPIVVYELLYAREKVTANTEDIDYDLDKRFRIIKAGVNGVRGIICFALCMFSLLIPTTTFVTVHGLRLHLSNMVKVVIHKKKLKAAHSYGSVDQRFVKVEQGLIEDDRLRIARKIYSSMDHMIWDTFLYSCMDLVFLPIGLVVACTIPSRFYVFFRQCFRVALKRECKSVIYPYCDEYHQMDRGKLYGVCARTLLFGIGDCMFIPCGLFALLIPSRSAVMFSQLKVMLFVDPIRAKDMDVDVNGMVLPGEAWNLFLQK
jgi:hypothetical protein